MKKMCIVFLTVFAVFCSCGDFLLENDYRGGDWFYLDNKGAVMPVWVRGNTSSGTFIIFLHGGPGRTGMTYATSAAHEVLQKQYALVYYDQRGSGMSQGNPSLETLTLKQFADDLDKIIALINHKYNARSVFLHGKSWGGAVGTEYLLDNKRQNKITGWIMESGSHNIKLGTPLSWEWVMEKGQEQINNGNRASHWRGEINWYKGLQNSPPELNTKYFMRHGQNVNDLNGIYRNPDLDPGDSFSWASPMPIFHILTTVYISNNNRFDMLNLDLSPHMNRIIIPSLVLWGRHDGTLPVDLAFDAYDHLGTVHEDRHIYIFENSAHMPSYEEPDLWLDKVRAFVEKYK